MNKDKGENYGDANYFHPDFGYFSDPDLLTKIGVWESSGNSSPQKNNESTFPVVSSNVSGLGTNPKSLETNEPGKGFELQNDRNSSNYPQVTPKGPGYQNESRASGNPNPPGYNQEVSKPSPAGNYYSNNQGNYPGVNNQAYPYNPTQFSNQNYVPNQPYNPSPASSSYPQGNHSNAYPSYNAGNTYQQPAPKANPNNAYPPAPQGYPNNAYPPAPQGNPNNNYTPAPQGNFSNAYPAAPQGYPNNAYPQPVPQGNYSNAYPQAAPKGNPNNAYPQPAPQGNPNNFYPQPAPQGNPNNAYPKPAPQGNPNNAYPQPAPQVYPNNTQYKPYPGQNIVNPQVYVQGMNPQHVYPTNPSAKVNPIYVASYVAPSVPVVPVVAVQQPRVITIPYYIGTYTPCSCSIFGRCHICTTQIYRFSDCRKCGGTGYKRFGKRCKRCFKRARAIYYH